MAYRIHVTAIRDTTTDAVRSTFIDILGESFADVQLVEHAGWISFRTSVWQVSSRDLINGLQQLNKPGLQFTTEDGSRWYVTMCKPDTEPETMIHEFGNHGDSELEEQYYADDDDDDYVDPELAFLEDEPQPSSRPRTPFHRFAAEFADLGAPLPQSLMDEVESLSFDAAIERFRTWHQDCFVEFLSTAGVRCDTVAVRRTLLWQGLTEVEHDSDIGNLPRLLMEIGLGEEWETYIAQAEEPQPEPEYQSDGQQEDDLADDPRQFLVEAERVIGAIKSSPVSDGPVKLPMEDFANVQFFPEACQIKNEIKTLLAVELPNPFKQEEFDQLTSGSNLDRAGCEKLPGGFKIGFENHLLVNWSHFRKQLGLDLSWFIEHLPDRSILTLAFAAEDEPSTRQLYRGEIRAQDWQIDTTHPPLPASVLSEALSLAADAPKTKHALRDTTEAEAVMEAVKKDSYLSDMDCQCDGNVVSCEYDVEFLAKILFRLRFRDYWSVEPKETAIENDYQDGLKMKWEFLRQAAKQARAQMGPRLGKPIHRGNASIYWRSDLNHFQDLDPETREKFERGMNSLNFSLLGDLNAKRFRDFVLHCYISPDGFSYATLTASSFGYFCWDFISDFSDGSRLTTTTSVMAFSRPAVKLYFKDFPGLEVEELYEKHLHLFSKFRDSKNALPVPLAPTLVGLAERFDDSLARTDTDEANCEDDDDYEDVDDFEDEEL